MDSAASVHKTLQGSIDLLDSKRSSFLKNPEKDFSRNRKIGFNRFIKICLNIGTSSTQNELLEYFNDSDGTPTKSAFCQQRAKVSPEAFEFLFHTFTDEIVSQTDLKKFHNRIILGADGSDINIPYNIKDVDTYHQNGSNRGYNQLHLNVIYDIQNGLYVDAIVNSDRKVHERNALISMVSLISLPPDAQAIILADRGYESYNVFAHLLGSGREFVIRLKDDDSNGILSNWTFPRNENGEFDCDYETILTWRQTNNIKENWEKYTFVSRDKFDLYEKDNPFFPLKLRIVCVEIQPGVYEYLATNLDPDEFSSQDIKELYHMRWGVETSFRDLKFTVDILHFHAKKRAFVEQEVWSKLIVFNFCKAITNSIAIPDESPNHKRKHGQKINFAIAAQICKSVLRRGDGETDISRLISRFLTPIRPDRRAPRFVKPKSAKSFLYRSAKA